MDMNRALWRAWIAGIVAAIVIDTPPGQALGGVDTVVGVRGLPGWSSLRKDINGDGLISDADIVLQLLDALGPGPDPDMDGDGRLTGEDTLRAVRRVLHASCGDVDGDVSVDAADLETESNAVLSGSTSVEHDANTDGTVDGLDVLFVMDNTGGEPWIFGLTVAWLADYLVQARNEGSGALWGPHDDTPDHHVEISEEWRSPPLEHSLEASLTTWPPNHTADESRQWPSHRTMDSFINPPAHGREITRLWPPAHRASISNDWDNPHNHEQSYREDRPRGPDHALYRSLQEHEASLSDLWDNPRHDVFYSDRWKKSPNHHRRHSIRWDPNGPEPENHRHYVSWRWPADHDPWYSQRDRPIIPRRHITIVSEEWPYHQHNERVSATWPPMHYLYISRSWIAHNKVFSTLWPPNHQGPVSSTWSPGVVPGEWAPNHLRSRSEQPGEVPPDILPAGPWPIWPPNHSWWTTIREIITLPGDVVNPFVIVGE